MAIFRASLRSVHTLGTSAILLLALASCSSSNSPAGKPYAPANGAVQPTSRQIANSLSPYYSTVPDGRIAATSPQAGSWMSHTNRRTGLVYVSDVGLGGVVVFDRNGTVRGQIGGLSDPEGLFVDGDHNLWLANSSASKILEFARGATSPSKTLNDPAGYPSDVTICPDGTVYVSNIYNFSGNGNIQVYPPGHTDPTRILTYPTEAKSWFLTCDAAGNIFTTITTNTEGTVLEYPSGHQPGATQLPIALSGFPGGIKPDKAGNILVSDQIKQTVTEYTEAGIPTGNLIKIIASAVCVDIAVDKAGNAVGCALFDPNQGGDSEGESYVFPGGAIRQTYSAWFNKPIGFAFDPGFELR